VQQLHAGRPVRAVVMQSLRERSLYRGSVPAAVSAVTENGVVFAANAVLKRAHNPRGETLSLTETACLGGAAGVFSATAIAPSEVIKVRMQANPAAWAGPVDCVVRTVRGEGAASLFRGLPAQLARDVPFNFAFFGAYETVSRGVAALRGVGKAELRVADQVAAGGLAGAAAWFVTLPADVVKTRVSMIREHDPRLGNLTLRVVRDTYNEGGVRAFFRGLAAVSVRAFPVNGALFASYEACSRWL